MRLAIYPGTFDPITNGHIDIIERCVVLFDSLIVSVPQSSQKDPLFGIEERVRMIEESVGDIPSVEVDQFEGLIVDYAKQRGAVALIRGLRAVSDFEYEFQMALVNRRMAPELITVFLAPSQDYVHLDSTIVREVAGYGGDVNPYVPKHVAQALAEKFGQAGGGK